MHLFGVIQLYWIIKEKYEKYENMKHKRWYCITYIDDLPCFCDVTLGFASILHKCLHSGDLTLQTHATRALYNLDTDADMDDLTHDNDQGVKPVYEDGIYLCHPQYKSRCV